MENEVSGIAKLGIVLIALAILIGLGFGIFQISKSVANDGVGQVQGELDSVGASKYSTYDQKNITGTMVSSALSDFEGENTAVLIATQAWKDACGTIAPATDTASATAIRGLKKADTLLASGKSAGLDKAKSGAYDTGAVAIPLVVIENATWQDSKGGHVNECFINYNAILGALVATGTGETMGSALIKESAIDMGTITFDGNCYKYSGPFATDKSGKVVFNNIITNVSKSGMTEYISSAAKFQSNLVKDNSGTTMGIAMEQIGG